MSNEKNGNMLAEKPVVDSEAKKDMHIQVDEFSARPPTSRMQNYRQLLRDLFTIKTLRRCGAVVVKFGQFTGPGTIISVAYIDPDNYQTAVSSGAEFGFKLLFMILVSNVIAIYLQVSTYSPEQTMKPGS